MKNINALDVAHGALHRNNSLDTMQLNKLCYLCYGWYSISNPEPLFYNRIESWQYGPIVPLVYHQFKQYSDKVIEYSWHLPEIKVSEELLENKHKKVIDFVIKKYQYSGMQLSALTHQDGSPWKQTYDRTINKEIKHGVIKKYFVSLADEVMARDNERKRR